MTLQTGQFILALGRRGRKVATADSRRTREVVARLPPHLLEDIGYFVVSGRIVAS